MRWLFVVVGLAGCVDETTTHSTLVSSRSRELARVEGPAGSPTLEVRVGTQILVVATRPRLCRQSFEDDLQLVNHIVATPSSGQDAVAWMIASARSGSRDEVVNTTTRSRVAEYPCPLPVVGVDVELELPSGRRAVGTTDDRGLATFEIPADEPDRGALIARGANLIAAGDYDRRPKPKPEAPLVATTGSADAARKALATTRTTATACAKHTTAPITLTLVFADGSVRAWTDRAGDRELEMCISRAIAAIRFPEMRQGTRLQLQLRP